MTGRQSGLDLSPFPRLTDIHVLNITPDPCALLVLRDMLESWNAPAPRALSLWAKPGYMERGSSGPSRKREYLAFLAELGRTVEGACSSRR